MEREKSAAAIKTAEITESEGQRQAEINRAEGEKQATILKAEGARQSEILEAEGDQQAAVLRAEGFSAALDKIYQVANTVDVKTMSLQYFETLKSLGSSPATKFIFPWSSPQCCSLPGPRTEEPPGRQPVLASSVHRRPA